MTSIRLLIGLGMVGLTACAGSREVSKLRYTSTDCPDPAGCGAPLDEPSYVPPDEARDPVDDAVATSEEPSCKTVAIALAAMELGNYASEDTDDERAAIVAKQTAACNAAKLDAREIACLSTVTVPDHVGYCSRKLGAPARRVPLMSARECTVLVDQIRPGFYNMKNALVAYETSCIQDGWPEEVGHCMSKQMYNPMSHCRAFAPGWVWDQLQARLDSATP